jgi:hypothetical protein
MMAHVNGMEGKALKKRTGTRYARLMGRSLSAAVLVLLAGCGPRGGPATGKRVAVARPPSGKAASRCPGPACRTPTPDVVLSPVKAGRYKRWRLTNRGRVPIHSPVLPPGFWGRIERQGPDGRWRFMRERAGCGTVSATVFALKPGGSIDVIELPPLGYRRPLPAGRYRFVVPFFTQPARPRKGGKILMPGAAGSSGREASGVKRWNAVRTFRVHGLSKKEAERLIAMLSRRQVWKCGLQDRALWAFVQGAPPAALRRLAALKPADLGEALTIVQVLRRFPELPVLVSPAIRRKASLIGLAAAIVVAGAFCGIETTACSAAMDRLHGVLKRSAQPPAVVVEALTHRPGLWPKGVLDRITDLLTTTRSKRMRHLAEEAVIAAMAVKRHRRRHAAVQARLRKGAADPKNAGVKTKILLFAKRLRDEVKGEEGHLVGSPLSPMKGFGMSGVALTGPCGKLWTELARLGRFTGRTQMTITVGPIEPVQAAKQRWGFKK